MAWIESHQKLERSGKLLQLASSLYINRYQAIGHLHSLWWWAIDNAPDGDITRFLGQIEMAVGWDDHLKTEAERADFHQYDLKIKDGDFIVACLEAGFLDKTESGQVKIHNWDEYTWRYFEQIERGEREREKWRLQKKSQRQSLEKCPPNVHVDSPPPVHPMSANVRPPPNLTIPNLTKDKDLAQKARATDLFFQTFWTEYPKHIAKAQAQKAWDKIRPNEELLRKIVTSLKAWKVTDQWRREGGQFIPYPASWLNARRWEDEITDGQNTRRSDLDRLLDEEAERKSRKSELGQVPKLFT